MKALARIVVITLVGCGTNRCPPGANADSLFCHRVAADVSAEPEADANAEDAAIKDGPQAEVVTIDASDAAASDAAASDAEHDASPDAEDAPDAVDPP